MIRLDPCPYPCPCPCPSERTATPPRRHGSPLRHLFLALILLASARLAAADPLTPAPANSTPMVPGSQQLALAFLDDLRQDRIEAAYAHMEARYRDLATVGDFKKSLAAVTDAYGQFLSFQFKARFDGNRLYPDQFVKPLSKYWFAVRTSQIESGVYSSVEVVPDHGAPAVASFSFVTFPNKLPEELK